jgi:hypothetical protein
VTRGNHRRSRPNGGELQGPMSRVTRPSLHVRTWCHSNSCDLKRNIEPFAKIRNEREFLRRLGPQPVIDSMSHDDVPQGSSQHHEDMQKRCRVWSSRTSDEHHVATYEEFVIPYRSFDETTERRRMRSAITTGEICTGQTSFRVQRSSNVLQKVTSET